jgi:hypothetical protein
VLAAFRQVRRLLRQPRSTSSFVSH